ncbi:MAG: diphthine--ammonia ligase [Candidatus Pacearchaeota archaeon]
MKLALLFSGGKDSTYAGYIALKLGYKISCLISIISENPDSYMFHTPKIGLTKKQAKLMDIPIISKKTKGEKEIELKDLEYAIKRAIKYYNIEGVITGAIESTYQASRIQEICDKLNIECFNPLWQKDQIQLLKELLKNKFEIIITKVAAEGLSKEYIGRKLDKKLIEELKYLQEKYKINPAGEGGEFETIVVNCPIFKSKMKVTNKNNMDIKKVLSISNNAIYTKKR